MYPSGDDSGFSENEIQLAEEAILEDGCRECEADFEVENIDWKYSPYQEFIICLHCGHEHNINERILSRRESRYDD